ncbi:unnamed protein product [Schistosoma haematobium]|nr:unnamed protein product [Schistosoma haematobium]
MIIIIILFIITNNCGSVQNNTNNNMTSDYNTTNMNTTVMNNNNNNNNNNLSTGGIIGIIIGLVIITTITSVIIFWCIRLRHLYLSQRHTKMYDPDMFQNSQIKNNGSLHYSSTSHQPMNSLQNSLASINHLQKYSLPIGQMISPYYKQQQFFQSNLNHSNEYHNSTIENSLKQLPDHQINSDMNLYLGERSSYTNNSYSSQSPNWTDQHYFNTNHFNGSTLFDVTSPNFQSYNKPTTDIMLTETSTTLPTINEPTCYPVYVHPLQSTLNKYRSSSSENLSSRHHNSRIKSIAFITHLSAFGLKNKRRFSQLTTKKLSKLKENTTSPNDNYNNKSGQLNPLPIAEAYESGSYHNQNMISDNFNFNAMESFDNDYFLYSLQTAVFNGFVPSNPLNQQYTYHDYYRMPGHQIIPTTTAITPILHEKFNQSSFGEDLSLGNNQSTTPSTGYYSSNRNSRVFSPDYNNNNNNNSNRFKFPPPGPPVAGWVNQFIIRANTLENSLSNVNTITSSTSPLTSIISLNERRAHQLQQQQQKNASFSSSLHNTPLNHSPITAIDIIGLSSPITIPSRSISSVPPSPQHIPFDFIHSSRSLGLTSSSVIPRRNNSITKYPKHELPIIGKRIIPIETDKLPVFTKLDFPEFPNDSLTVLKNNFIKPENNILLHNLKDNNNNTTNTQNNNNNMSQQQYLSPLNCSDPQHSDSGYNDSLIIPDQKLSSLLLLSSSSTSSSIVHSSIDFQSPTNLSPLFQYDTIHNSTECISITSPITTTSTMNSIFSDTVEMIHNYSVVDNHIENTVNNNNNKSNQYVYCKLELPLSVTQSIPVSLSSVTAIISSPSSKRSSTSSRSTEPSSANSTTVILRENLDVNRKLSYPTMNNFNSTNRNQTMFRSPSDPDIFFSFCDESINNKSTLTQQQFPSIHLSNHYKQQQHHHPTSVPLSRTNYTSNNMMKLMMMSTLSDSFKYHHLIRQKSESQLLTDRHDSFDEISWDLQPTPLY